MWSNKLSHLRQIKIRIKCFLEIGTYLEKHCLYVTSQATRQAVDLLTSLMQMNTNERLKEQTMLKQDMSPAEETKKTEEIKQNDSKLLALVPVSVVSSKSNLPKRKALFPWDRAANDIEKAKKKKLDKLSKKNDKKLSQLSFLSSLSLNFCSSFLC